MNLGPHSAIPPLAARQAVGCSQAATVYRYRRLLYFTGTLLYSTNDNRKAVQPVLSQAPVGSPSRAPLVPVNVNVPVPRDAAVINFNR